MRMLNAGFQYLEQRDKDGLIAKNGVVSKDSPFTTGDNNGLYDVIAEDLRWLYDNRTAEGGTGQVGPAGKDGASAYEIAKAHGFTGTEYEWLRSLHGVKGDTGSAGVDGKDGASAYEVAVKNGFAGTEADWLASMKGAAGKSNYEIAVANGYKGTEADWLKEIKGADGAPGTNGVDGKDGKDGKDGLSAYELAVKHGYASSEATWLASLQGKDGANGKDGKDGSDGRGATVKIGTITVGDKFDVKNSGSANASVWDFEVPSFENITRGENGYSAYDIAKQHGFAGDEVAWLSSLVGPQGKSAYEAAVENGYKGTVEAWLKSLRGYDGTSARITIGEAKVGDKLALTNTGTELDAVLNFTFPQEWGNGGVPGKDGRNAYEVAQDNGFTGTVTDWLASLRGTDGKDGKDGADGMSAYEVAVANGYSGTASSWLASLQGKNGLDGKDGEDGRSAYELASIAGYTKTEAEWLESLHGKDAYRYAVEKGFVGTEDEWLDSMRGTSAYQTAVENGFQGTETEWIASLHGAAGKDGKDGAAATVRVGTVKTGDAPSVVNVGTEKDAVLDFTLPAGGGADGGGTGEPGADGKSAFEIAVAHGYTGSETSWLASLKGADGAAGKSAYEVAVAEGFSGTEAEWLASLQGADGRSAYDVALANGYKGDEASWLASLRGRNGATGATGRSAYESAVANGFVGTEAEWLASLKGEKGDASGSVTKNVIELSIPAASWKNKEFSFTNSLIEADSVVFLGLPTDTEVEVFKAVAQACISCVWQEGGYMTLRAMQTVPTIDVKLELVVM